MGELAALGLVLCARLAGDASRRRALRVAAAAACAPLGLGLYITFSRGALAACMAGLLTLVVLAPQREQLKGLFVSILAGTLAAAVAAPLHGVTALAGGTATRERQGALMLVVLVAIAAGAGGLMLALTRRLQPGAMRLPRHKGLIATAVVCAGLAAAIVVGAHEQASRPLSAGATRLVTLQSNRYAYWRVALRAFRDEPLRGVGAGGWAVYWLRYRPFGEFAHDAHSLPLQTAAELGLVGLLLLTAFLVGVALAAQDAYRGAPGLAIGPIAAMVVYAVHAPLDWDWQMPAVTIVALLLAGVVIVLAELDRSAHSSSATRGASRLKIHAANAQMAR
jgi:O-antigen ligase